MRFGFGRFITVWTESNGQQLATGRTAAGQPIGRGRLFCVRELVAFTAKDKVALGTSQNFIGMRTGPRPLLDIHSRHFSLPLKLRQMTTLTSEGGYLSHLGSNLFNFDLFNRRGW
jgi:hypothetical protein